MTDDPLWDEISDPPRYYDRGGEPITMRQWSKLFEDDDHKVVQHTLINGRWFVSTVWLGLDHGFWWPRDRPHLPLIFETMVFDHTAEPDRRYHDLEMERYHTEEAARAGHAEMVRRVTGWIDGPPEPDA